MVEQRRKDPGRKGRPADGGGQARRGATRPPRRRTARSRAPRTDEHRRTVVRPSARWRPMRRVGDEAPAVAAAGGPQAGHEQPSPAEPSSSNAQQQTEQMPPRHGKLGWLFQRR